jgi:hypothetical protein
VRLVAQQQQQVQVQSQPQLVGGALASGAAHPPALRVQHVVDAEVSFGRACTEPRLRCCKRAPL